MSEISSAIAEAIRKRAASATLGTYLFFWSVYHWQGLYVTFFVNQDLIYGQHGLLKNEYVDKYFFGINSWNDWNFYLGLLAPAALTYLFIWWIPLILLKAYKKEQWFKVEKRIIRIDQEKRVQEDRKELAQETAKAVKEEVKTVQAKKQAAKIDPKILWDEEIRLMKDTGQFAKLKDVFVCYYQYGGERKVASQFPSHPVFELNADSLRIADANELVTISTNGKIIKLTDKGKYFASKYEGKI